jgi:hypothetical protein
VLKWLKVLQYSQEPAHSCPLQDITRLHKSEELTGYGTQRRVSESTSSQEHAKRFDRGTKVSEGSMTHDMTRKLSPNGMLPC